MVLIGLELLEFDRICAMGQVWYSCVDKKSFGKNQS